MAGPRSACHEDRLAPGGLVCVTTRPRRQIELLGATATSTAKQELARYDRGEFVFRPDDEPDGQLYGEAIVPEAYARRHWAGPLEFVAYVDNYATSYMQPAIVLRRKP